MRKQTTLYNVIFPVWLLLLVPTVWLVALPANFLFDSLVLLLAFHVLKLTERKALYKQAILRVWGFGFLADIVASLLLLLTQVIGGSGADSPVRRWFSDNIVGPVAYNPFANPFALIIVLIAVAAAGVLIYFFNVKFALRRWPVEDWQRRKTALLLALLTAPYTMLIPAAWLYRGV